MKFDTENFVSSDESIAKLEAIPGINDDLTDRMAAREEMEREYRLGLSKIREAAQLTQTQMAEMLGVGQTSVSRLESRPDMLLSTLRKYLDAAGATHPRIVVTINGHEHEVNLDAFA